MGGFRGEKGKEVQPCASLFSASLLSQNDSTIHSSSALPDFNFTINQQNKQTSGRQEDWMEGWGGVGCRGAVAMLHRRRFSMRLFLYRQELAARKALRRTAEAADWRCGAHDERWKQARARL